MIIHFAEQSDTKDLLIMCYQKWTEPAWYSNVLPKLESEVYWAEPIENNYVPYTYDKSNVTCLECLKKIKV